MAEADRLMGVDVREHEAERTRGRRNGNSTHRKGRVFMVRRHDGGVDARITYRSNSWARSRARVPWLKPVT